MKLITMSDLDDLKEVIKTQHSNVMWNGYTPGVEFVSRLEETLREAIESLKVIRDVTRESFTCKIATDFLTSVNSAADSSEGKNEGDTKYIENIKNAATEISSWPQWKVDSMKAYFSETIPDNESSNESGDV